MTLNLTVNRDLGKIFNSIDNPHNNAVNNTGAKVIINAAGQVEVSNRSRGLFSFNSPSINQESRRTLDTLRRSLVDSLNEVEGAADKVDNILKKHLNERQLSGKQRLTLRDLISIRSTFISLKTIRSLAQEFQQPNQVQQQGNQRGQADHVSPR
uniref:hypothetical protein n=1 Tax=Succinimonas sp. TaxID=1936151 RepID=UPI0038708421